ncbi:MAG: cell division protein FtsH, partial [Cyanobacteria bacterium J06606_4]
MRTEIPSQSTFATFVEQVRANQVQRATIKPHRIEYQLKPAFGGQRLFTQVTDSTLDVSALLRQHKVAITHLENSSAAANLVGLLLSTGALVGAFAWLAKAGSPGGVGSVMGAGRSRARTYTPTSSQRKRNNKATVTFADVAGVDEAKQELQEVVDFLQDGEK